MGMGGRGKRRRGRGRGMLTRRGDALSSGARRSAFFGRPIEKKIALSLLLTRGGAVVVVCGRSRPSAPFAAITGRRGIPLSPRRIFPRPGVLLYTFDPLSFSLDGNPSIVPLTPRVFSFPNMRSEETRGTGLGFVDVHTVSSNVVVGRMSAQVHPS